MTTIKIRRQFDKSLTFKGEVNLEPSMTVPDMNMTIRQLLENHTRGISSDVTEYTPQYFGDLEVPRFEDITDMYEHRKKIEYEAQQLADRLQAEHAAKKKAARDKAAEPPKPQEKSPEPPSEPSEE